MGIQTQSELARSPFAGVLFEGFIASEIVKAQINQGRRRELYYFREEQALEVGFVVPGANGRGEAVAIIQRLGAPWISV